MWNLLLLLLLLLLLRWKNWMSYSNHKPSRCRFFFFYRLDIVHLDLFLSCLESEKQIKILRKTNIPRPILLVCSFLVFDPSIKKQHTQRWGLKCANAKHTHFPKMQIWMCRTGKSTPCQLNKKKDKTKRKSKAWIFKRVCVFGKLSIFLCTREKTTEQVRKAGKRTKNTHDNRKQSEIAIAGQAEEEGERETVYILPVFRFILLHWLFVCLIAILLVCSM